MLTTPRLVLLLFFFATSIGKAESSRLIVESDFPAWWFGSYSPSGMVAVGTNNTLGNVESSLTIGFESRFDPVLSLSLMPTTPVIELGKLNSYIEFGTSWVHTLSYQRMTDEERTVGDDQHYGTYDVADQADFGYAHLGLKANIDFSATHSGYVRLGWNHKVWEEYKNRRREEIRNCYIDDCDDSNKSGGGTWPQPEYSYYFGAGWALF